MKVLLFILIAFVAITATLSGMLMITNPDGGIMSLHLGLLQNSPFKSFLIPGIVLLVVVGGVNLIAVLFNMQHHPHRYNWALAGGLMLCGWIVVQMILINGTSWLQYIYLGTGILIILIAYQLKGKWAV